VVYVAYLVALLATLIAWVVVRLHVVRLHVVRLHLAVHLQTAPHVVLIALLAVLHVIAQLAVAQLAVAQLAVSAVHVIAVAILTYEN